MPVPDRRPSALTRRRAAALLTGLAAGSVFVRAQGPIEPRPAGEKPHLDNSTVPAAAPDESVIRVDVNLVNLFFTVRKSGEGALVPDLKQEDFLVFEDGKPQTIANFSRESNLPLEIGMLFDVSASQTRLIETERSAAAAFFANVIRPKDEAFLLAFGHDTLLVEDFTGSVPRLQSGLNSLKGDLQLGQNRQGGSAGGYPGGGGGYPGGGGGGSPFPGGRFPGGIGGMGGGRRRGGGYPSSRQSVRGMIGTKLFDAVSLAATDEMRAKTGRKAVILITDGDDHGSYYTRDQAIEAALRSDTLIYSIYYADERINQRFNHGASPGLPDLHKMSEDTGGRVFKVSADHTLEDVFTDLQAEMRSQYSLAYKSTNPDRNGEYREVEIRARNSAYLIQGRKGYYAVKNRTA